MLFLKIRGKFQYYEAIRVANPTLECGRHIFNDISIYYPRIYDNGGFEKLILRICNYLFLSIDKCIFARVRAIDKQMEI